MARGAVALVAGALLAGCSPSSSPSPSPSPSSSPSPSPSPPAGGKLLVAITVDWEGAYLSSEGLDGLDAFRRGVPGAPLTHFVSAGYFTKAAPDPAAIGTLEESVRPGDELAVHLHAWRSLAVASQITPRLTPSFLTGTAALLEFEDGDVGFDLDLDAYDVRELRALLQTSRRLLAQTARPVSRSFRAGGYLGTPKVLQALEAEGFLVDSSATDYRQLDERTDVLPGRVQATWPRVTTGTQPFAVGAPGGPLLEVPIAAFAEYATTDEMVAMFDAAAATLKAAPGRDVVIVLGFHQETAAEFAPRVGEALTRVRAQPAVAAALEFVTVEQAAARVRPPAPAAAR